VIWLTRTPTLTATIVAASLVVIGPAAGVAARAFFARRSRQAADARSGTRAIVYAGLELLAPFALSIAGIWAAAHVLPLGPAVAGGVDIVLQALLILLLTVIAGRLAGAMVRAYATQRAGVEASSIFVSVTWFVVAAVGALIALQTLGVSITPLLTALGVGGLAVALALQDTLANLFAGIHILASKKVRPGDYIRLDTGQEGYIVDITWRNTVVRQLTSNMVLVPNSKLSTAVVVNYYRPQLEMTVPVEMGVSAKSDLEEVERVTVEVARDVMRNVKGGIPDHQPVLRYRTITDSRIGFSVMLKAREYSDQYLITHEFIKRLHGRYRAEGLDAA
jgi:small-conductance mechanosensitive channel